MSIKNPSIFPHAALMVAMIVWGSSFVALKIAIAEVSPMWVVFLRMAIGALALILIWKWWFRTPDYRRGDWKWLIGMALFEPCLYFIFEAKAMMYTSAGQAGMVVATLPLMVAIAAYFAFGEKSTKSQWLGLLIAISGVILMTLASPESLQAPNPLLGNTLEFLAMSCAVGYVLVCKHLVQRYSPFFLTAMQSFVGTLFFFPLALTDAVPHDISAKVWGVLIYLGIVVTLGAYGLYNYAMHHVTASVAASYTNLLPAFSILFSMVLLDEMMLPVQWLAIGLIFIGVATFQAGQKAETAIPNTEAPAWGTSES